MAQAEFTLPEFLEGQDVASVHARMLAAIPDGFDKSEGGFVWDMTYPTALEKSQAAQYLIPEALRSMFPLWARGDMLDMHAANRGMARKPAQEARCVLRFSGENGAKVPRGTAASTQATSQGGAVTFITDEDAVLSGNAASVSAHAQSRGVLGNVAAGSICRLDAPIAGISAVTNEQAAQGGLDMESDAQLRARIVEFDAAQGRNYVGSTADYRRWALEVNGVGSATVLAATDDSGLVTIMITDSQGASASDELCKAVEAHIMRPDEPAARLAPINARISVITPAPVNISISARVVLDGVLLADVKREFVRLAKGYAKDVDDKVIRISRLGTLLLSVPGVRDYADMKLNGTSGNVTLNERQLPVIDESGVTLT
ncbi:MAG: baseplate J/gp47 family protein [Candidatus Fimadaptatus sp.]|jgi:uncharacterized phage protein gp47/JayE